MAKTKRSEDVRRAADVLIGGGGFAGLALAIALRQGLGDPFKVTVADPALGKTHTGDARASAIAAAARRLFETIGVWDKVADGAQPILDMVVTDSKLPDVMRPTYLTFGGEVAPGEPFAHMIENPALVDALVERAKAEGVELRARRGYGFRGQRGSHRSAVSPTASGLPQNSWSPPMARVRRSARRPASAASAGTTIRPASSPPWRTSAIITAAPRSISCRRGRSRSCRCKGKRSSIVWTEEKREAERIVALPDDGFHAELEKRFGLKLGEIEVAGPRRAYPLGLSMARSFVGERLALIGDAAHVIHPIAGQGLNLGLRDVAALAEAVVDAARLGLDPGGPDVLERYQRWRRFDTAAMGVATDGLNRLFSNRSDALRLVRDVGLGLVDRVPALKGLFIREAAGLTGDVPKLLRGEAL